MTVHPLGQAVRAEAVAEERQRLAQLVDALPNPDRAQNPQFAFGWNAAKAIVREALAAGSVPVAIPPEPTVEIGGVTMTQRQYDAARYPLLHPPTCEHGQTAGHWWPPGPEGYEVCPGPVATTAEPAALGDGE